MNITDKIKEAVFKVNHLKCLHHNCVLSININPTDFMVFHQSEIRGSHISDKYEPFMVVYQGVDLIPNEYMNEGGVMIVKSRM